MSYTKRLMQAVDFNREYSPTQLASMTHIEPEEVSRALGMLCSGGVIEQTKTGRFLKDRAYKSKQRSLKI